MPPSEDTNQIPAMPAPVTKESGTNKRLKKIHSKSGRNVFYEFACSPNSMLGEVSPVTHVRLCKEQIDLCDPPAIEQLQSQIEATPGCTLLSSIPCTLYCPWQRMAISKYGSSYIKKLHKRREAQLPLLLHSLQCGQTVIDQGGTYIFEWPDSSDGWKIPILEEFIQRNKLHTAVCAGCRFGLTNDAGIPMRKRWRFVTNNERLAKDLAAHDCCHEASFVHAPVEGKYTAQTAYYPRPLCELIHNSLFKHKVLSTVPCFPCVPLQPQTTHREKEGESSMAQEFKPAGFVFESSEESTGPSLVPAMVTKLLTRAEMLADPLAIAAVKAEADGLQARNTWDLSTVQELDAVKGAARKSGNKVHIGSLMTLAHIKYFEREESEHKRKGRIVYRGDITKDEH